MAGVVTKAFKDAGLLVDEDRPLKVRRRPAIDVSRIDLSPFLPPALSCTARF